MVEDYLAQGAAAAQAGNREEARRLFAAAIRLAPNDERTWGRFYLVADTDQERMDCLQQILRINPENATARQILGKQPSPEQPIQPSKKNEKPAKEKIIGRKKKPEKKENPGRDFENDGLVRKISRSLLIFQVCAVLIGIIFLLFHKRSITLLIAVVALVLVLGALSWFYIRYRSYPLVQEKRRLDQQARSLQAQKTAQSANIQLTDQNQAELEQAENNEIEKALLNLQKEYIETRMINVRIAEADIPGIGPELKQGLADNGYTTAADINPKVIYVKGFGGAQTREILDWQDRVYFQFHATRPDSLPAGKLEEIKKKYEIDLVSNYAQQQKIQAEDNELENKLKEIRPRMDLLAPLTFFSFLRHGLASRAFMAGLIGLGILGSQVLLGAGAVFGAMRGSVPAATLTPTKTLAVTTETATTTQTITLTSTLTPTPTMLPAPTGARVSVSTATNCRTGPNTKYAILGVLQIGESAQVVGRSVLTDVMVIRLPSDPSLTCWLWAQHATVSGDLSQLPIIAFPTPP